jgi:UDP-2,3-diacylglucosamine hydrolase
LSAKKNIYFASDFHLGIPDHASSLEREKRIVRWLDFVKQDATEIYLVGDLFDFWFEYDKVVPKGFVRLLGKLAEICDSGIPIHIFHGNHDLWMFGYLEQEIGCKVYSKPVEKEIYGKKFYIAHGDGIGPGQKWFKFILSIYRNYFFQRLFAFFHPSIGISLANWFSHRSKQNHFEENVNYLGDDKEFHILFAKEYLKQHPIDFFILAHRHLPMDKIIGSAHVINLGDWMSYNTYVVFDGEKAELKTFE